MGEKVIIIGGGPAGSASAMNLLQLGFDPVIVESDVFPRFHIGESLTTECVDALYRLGLERELEALGAPKKNGVRIFSRHPENSFYVGAGDAWQVERARFDAMMLDVAIQRGAHYLPGRVVRLTRENSGWQLEIQQADGQTATEVAGFVIDASGQKRFSYRQGLWPSLTEGGYAHQIALFSQYQQVMRQPGDHFDTLIFHRDRHEWCWMIPLSETVTSIGLVLPVHTYKKEKQSADQYLDDNLATFSEPLDLRFKQASRVGAVRVISNYSYQIDQYAANGLYCVGDSHRFIDPIFSFGVEFAVVEAAYAARAIAACSRCEPDQWAQHEQKYQQITTSAQNVIHDMLAYFWAHPWGFANMAHIRYRDEFLEIFAGRIYEREEGAGLKRMRAALA